MKLNNNYFDNQLAKEIGERLRKERESRNLSISVLLDKLSDENNCGIYYLISDSQYRRYEQGQSMSVQILVALSFLYGISVDYLIFGTTEKGHCNQLSKSEADIISKFLIDTARNIKRITNLEE